MNYTGILIGLCSFLIIGLFHPIVIKAEYYIGKKCWPAFLVLGVFCIIAAGLSKGFFTASLLAILGFTLLWSIQELVDQEKRVEKGWFPANPNKDKKALQE
ncbi:MAG: DUF4491 family protein [Clostridioides sp.]|jgi:hypothetical protein|nr:DUF4491 family protein [Clostridioides sp.]